MIAPIPDDAEPTDAEPAPPAASYSWRSRTMPARAGHHTVLVLRTLADSLERELDELGIDRKRPTMRSECLETPRPCPWVGCAHHLYADVVNGGLRLNFPGIDPDEIPETCSLDVADAGPSLHSEIAPLLGITRQAVHQIEQHALTKLARPGRGARRLLGDHDGT